MHLINYTQFSQYYSRLLLFEKLIGGPFNRFWFPKMCNMVRAFEMMEFYPWDHIPQHLFVCFQTGNPLY